MACHYDQFANERFNFLLAELSKGKSLMRGVGSFSEFYKRKQLNCISL